MIAPVHQLPRRRFIVIRHGETDANRDQVIAGRIEATLTPRGRQAAEGLAQRTWPNDLRVFCSPQQRAMDTARLAFPAHEVTVIAGLRERDWGVFEGRPVRDAPPRHDTPEGGEAWMAVIDRVALAVHQAVEIAGPAVPVLVAHSGVIRAVRALTGGCDDGPSPCNTVPYVYTPNADGDGWQEAEWTSDQTAA